MKAVVNALVLAGTLAALQTALPGKLAAEEQHGSGQEGADRWITSVAVISGITFQDWDASVESVVCRGCGIPDPLGREEPLQLPANGDDRDVTPFVGANLELMTPELSLPGSPRLFLGGEVAGAFGTERKLAQEGEPGTINSGV